MSSAPVILLEFNELCPSLMDKFIKAGKLPNFEKLYKQSQVYVTDAEEEQSHLEPWIQWVTVHTGLSYEQHGIFDLGDAHKLKEKSLWDILNEHGHKVWICGSMNVRYDENINGSVLPDAWSTETVPHPDKLNHFFNFVRTNVQEHTNTSVPLSKMDYIRFAYFLLTHGISADTIFATIKQLIKEKTEDTHWKRATILDKIQWDVFAHQYKKLKPNFSTFFINSVAHFQHKYWRNMEPEKFTLKPTQEEQDLYKDAILYGYQEMDKIVAKALSLAGGTATIMLSTALSQQPYLSAEDEGGKHFYRPIDFDNFIDFVGLNNALSCSPVMSEQFHLYFKSEQEAEASVEVLKSLTVNGVEAFDARRDGTDVFAGCSIFSQISNDALLVCNNKSIPFYDLFYQANSIKSGMHHPDGIFWVRTPSKSHAVHPGRIPLRSIAPTVLAQFGIEAPSKMHVPALNEVA